MQARQMPALRVRVGRGMRLGELSEERPVASPSAALRAASAVTSARQKQRMMAKVAALRGALQAPESSLEPEAAPVVMGSQRAREPLVRRRVEVD